MKNLLFRAGMDVSEVVETEAIHRFRIRLHCQLRGFPRRAFCSNQKVNVTIENLQQGQELIDGLAVVGLIK